MHGKPTACCGRRVCMQCMDAWDGLVCPYYRDHRYNATTCIFGASVAIYTDQVPRLINNNRFLDWSQGETKAMRTVMVAKLLTHSFGPEWPVKSDVGKAIKRGMVINYLSFAINVYDLDEQVSEDGYEMNPLPIGTVFFQIPRHNTTLVMVQPIKDAGSPTYYQVRDSDPPSRVTIQHSGGDHELFHREDVAIPNAQQRQEIENVRAYLRTLIGSFYELDFTHGGYEMDESKGHVTLSWNCGEPLLCRAIKAQRS